MYEDKQVDANHGPNLPEELKSFAGHLNQFRAKSVSFERDRILFEAGRSAAQKELSRIRISHRKSLRVWQTTAIVLLVVSIGLGTRVGSQSEIEPQFASKQLHTTLTVTALPSTTAPPVSVATNDSNSDSTSNFRPGRISLPTRTAAVAIDQSVDRIADELRARQSRIEDAFASINGIDHRSSGASDASGTTGSGRALNPERNTRGTRRNEQIRDFINQLTQESHL